MRTDVPHFVRGYIRYPRGDSQQKHLTESEVTGFQSLIYEINDFPE